MIYLAFSTFYKTFKRIATTIGRPDARPHDLRHTFAMTALAAGADLKSVQDTLGHATASFTLLVYSQQALTKKPFHVFLPSEGGKRRTVSSLMSPYLLSE